MVLAVKGSAARLSRAGRWSLKGGFVEDAADAPRGRLALGSQGLRELHEGQRVSFDLERDNRSGKTSAGNLRVGD